MNVAVIGLGYMGKNHIRILSSMSDVTITGVCDVAAENRDWAATVYNLPTFAHFRQMLSTIACDAMIISVPTSLHYTVARYALSLEKDVLLEKPITTSSALGTQLLQLADAKKRVFVVGHTERFNPMVLKMKRMIEQGKLGKILQVRVRRLSPYPGRKQDVGVLMDLATHDLDVLRFLFGVQVAQMHSIYRQLRSPTYEDVAVLILTFRNGIMATINVSWVTPDKVRDIAVEGSGGMLVGNYLTQELRFSKDWVPGKAGTRVAVAVKEPLLAELDDFKQRILARDLLRESVASAIESVEMVEHVLSRGQFLK